MEDCMIEERRDCDQANPWDFDKDEEEEMPQPTELQIFIDTAAGFYRAIGELADIASRYSADSFKRAAAKAEDALQKTLDGEVQDWNDEDDAAHPHITLCASQATWPDGKCELYTTNGEYCATCVALRQAEQAA